MTGRPTTTSELGTRNPELGKRALSSSAPLAAIARLVHAGSVPARLPIAHCQLPIERQRRETGNRETVRPDTGDRVPAVSQLSTVHYPLSIAKGFTLLEVILVLLIIAVVATLAVASFWGAMTSQRIKESPIAIATLYVCSS